MNNWTTAKPKCFGQHHQWAEDPNYSVAGQGGGIIYVESCNRCGALRRIWTGDSGGEKIVKDFLPAPRYRVISGEKGNEQGHVSSPSPAPSSAPAGLASPSASWS